MANAFIPLGTASGPGWQYRIERGDSGIYSPWRNWTEDVTELAFTEDPSGGDLLTDTLYWVYARNAALPPGQPGAIDSELAASIVILPSGAIVPGSPTGNPTSPTTPTGPTVAAKTLLQLAQEANLTSSLKPQGDMPEVKYQFGYKLSELTDYVVNQYITFVGGAMPVIQRVFGQAAGLVINGPLTQGGALSQDLKIEAGQGVTRWIDRFGSWRTETAGIIFDYARALFDSALVRVGQLYIINQDEQEATDYVTTSNPVGSLGSFKQNRITVAKLFAQLTSSLRVVFSGEVVVRTFSRSILPSASRPVALICVAEVNPVTGESADKWATPTQLTDALIAEITARLPGVSGNQGVFLGCIEAEDPVTPTLPSQTITVSSVMDGAPVPHPMNTVAPLMTAYTLADDGTYFRDDTIRYNPTGDTANLYLSIPGGGPWSGKLILN